MSTSREIAATCRAEALDLSDIIVARMPSMLRRGWMDAEWEGESCASTWPSTRDRWTTERLVDVGSSGDEGTAPAAAPSLHRRAETARAPRTLAPAPLPDASEAAPATRTRAVTRRRRAATRAGRAKGERALGITAALRPHRLPGTRRMVEARPDATGGADRTRLRRVADAARRRATRVEMGCCWTMSWFVSGSC